MGLLVPLGSQLVTTTNATFGIAVPTGQIWRLRAVNIQQAVSGVAKTILLALGTTATAANVKLRYGMLLGQLKVQDFPDIVMVAGDQLNVITDLGTNEAVLSCTVLKDLIA
jgi:hypothetical protein